MLQKARPGASESRNPAIESEIVVDDKPFEVIAVNARFESLLTYAELQYFYLDRQSTELFADPNSSASDFNLNRESIRSFRI